MPTNGETVYKTYAELHADKWAEVVARISAEADADYNNEIDRAKAKAKAINDLIKSLESQTAKMRAGSARIQPGDLATARKLYQVSLKEQSITQGREADARDQNRDALQKARGMALAALPPSTTDLTAISKAAADVGQNSVIRSIGDPTQRALAIKQQLDADGTSAKVRAATTETAQLGNAIALRDALAEKYTLAEANDVIDLIGFEPAEVTQANYKMQYDAAEQQILGESYASGAGALNKTQAEQVAQTDKLRAQVAAAEKAVGKAKLYVNTPKYRQMASLSEEELAALPEADVAEFRENRATILANTDLFRGELNDAGISGGATSRIEELRQQAKEAEAAAPRRKTQLDILREANRQYEPVYGKGGIGQGIRDTFAPVVKPVGPGSYDDKISAANARVFALNWKDAQALAKQGITIDPNDRNVGYLLFDTSKGALTPKQLVEKAKEAAGDDPEKLNEIVRNYMKKKLAKDQTAQAAIKVTPPEPGMGAGYVKPQTPYDQTAAEDEDSGPYANTAAGEGPYRPDRVEIPPTEETMDQIAAGLDEPWRKEPTRRDRLKLFLLKARDKGNARTIKTLDQYDPS